MSLPQAHQPGSGPDSAHSGVTTGGPRTQTRWPRIAEHLVALVLGLLVLVVHDVGYLLSQSFWSDEAWVALSTRFPLSKLPVLTDATPIGWSLLMRLVTVPGQQTSRLLPLAFAGAAVMVAYWLGRNLGWSRPQAAVTGGVLTGTAVLLVPAMLARDDLKEYTADACMALAVLALTSRLERHWSRPRLAALSVAVWSGMLVSHTTAFVGAAAFVALCGIQLARRAWRRLAEATAVGAATAILMACVFEAFDARAMTPGLIAFWRASFVPVGNGLHASVAFVTSRLAGSEFSFGLGPGWLALPLVLAGLVTLFRLGRPATAVTVVVLWPEMFALSALQKYPFLDHRTSTFLYVVTAAVAAIGVAGVCSLLQPVLRGTLAAALAVLAVTAFVIHVQPRIRTHPFPHEDTRDQVSYVVSHRARGDAILVNSADAWAFAYYWPDGAPSLRPDRAGVGGYQPYFPSQPDIVIPPDLDADGAAVSAAVAIARREACGRIWLVLAHASPGEIKQLTTDLHRNKLTVTPVGDDGLRVAHAGGTTGNPRTCEP